jgi:hypothetical protein
MMFVKPSAVAASTGVATIQQHGFEQISSFAREALTRWRASGERDITDAAIAEELDKLPDLEGTASLIPSFHKI